MTHEAGVPLKGAQEILGDASERTTRGIYTHSRTRQRDDSTEKIAALPGLAGNNRETTDKLTDEDDGVSEIGSPGRTRTSDQRINSPSLYQLSYRGTEPVAGRGILEDASRQVKATNPELLVPSES